MEVWISQICVSVVRCLKWNKESDDTESILIARKKGGNIISYVNFF